jgi:enolase
MTKIKSAKARKVIDSRGNFTVEVEIWTETGHVGSAIAPSGASKGSFEVQDYPEGNLDKGITIFGKEVAPKLVGQTVEDQARIDALFHKIDGTPNFARIGGNVTIAASMAVVKAAAASNGQKLYKYLLKGKKGTLPYPVSNVVGGGKHAVNGTTIQEFLAVAFGKTFKESITANIMVHKEVGKRLRAKFSEIPIGLGDEKAWIAPMDDTEVFDMMAEAIAVVTKATGTKINQAVDFAASSYYENGKYKYRNKTLSRAEQIKFVADLGKKYEIKIEEDPLEEDDFAGFAELNKLIGSKSIIVGDDLFVTNKGRLEKGIEMKAGNGILIKPNQIGTVTDMIETINLAKKNGYTTEISHRSGESEDTTIAHLAVGLGMEYIKSGTVGGERTAKYNELIRIEEEILGGG